MSNRAAYFRRHYMENRARIRQRQAAYYNRRKAEGRPVKSGDGVAVEKKIARVLNVSRAEARIMLGVQRDGDFERAGIAMAKRNGGCDGTCGLYVPSNGQGMQAARMLVGMPQVVEFSAAAARAIWSDDGGSQGDLSATDAR